MKEQPSGVLGFEAKGKKRERTDIKPWPNLSGGKAKAKTTLVSQSKKLVVNFK